MKQTMNVILVKYRKNFLKLNNFNPFLNVPELQSIWPEDSLKIAIEATQEALDDAEDHMYLIALSSGNRFNPEGLEIKFIGITGFFNNSFDGSKFSLRWHGIIPEYRGLGYSEKALEILKNTIREEFPKVEYLQEFIPLHESREYLFNYFQKQGFQKFGEVEFPEWSNHPIQQVRTLL